MHILYTGTPRSALPTPLSGRSLIIPLSLGSYMYFPEFRLLQPPLQPEQRGDNVYLTASESREPAESRAWPQVFPPAYRADERAVTNLPSRLSAPSGESAKGPSPPELSCNLKICCPWEAGRGGRG